MQDDVRYFVVLAAVAVVLCQYTKIIQNPKILVDDVLFGGSSILCGYDVQLLRALRTLKDELEEPNCRFSGSGG